MIRAGLSSFSLHIPDALLGDPWFELDEDGKSVSGSFQATPTLDLLDFPAMVASHGIHCVDLCMQHVPNIDALYLAELRSAFAAAEVKLYQVLIDFPGEIASSDPAERDAAIAKTKRWIEISAELGATGVRYVPGDSQPNPENIRATGLAFRELYDFCVACDLDPATENFKKFNSEADDLLGVIDASERVYGLVADIGNANGPNKYETLEKLLPRATAIHLWVMIDSEGAINVEDANHCLNMARDAGFVGPIMLLGGRPYQQYRDSRELGEAVDELRGLVADVFAGRFETEL